MRENEIYTREQANTKAAMARNKIATENEEVISALVKIKEAASRGEFSIELEESETVRKGLCLLDYTVSGAIQKEIGYKEMVMEVYWD